MFSDATLDDHGDALRMQSPTDRAALGHAAEERFTWSNAGTANPSLDCGDGRAHALSRHDNTFYLSGLGRLGPGESHLDRLGRDANQTRSSARLIEIESDSLVDIAYEGSISGIKFSLHIDADTPTGNYNICAIAPSGARACIPGGIVVLP